MPSQVGQDIFNKLFLFITEVALGLFLKHGNGIDGMFGQGQVLLLFACPGIRDFPEMKEGRRTQA